MMDAKEKREWTNKFTSVNENDESRVDNPILFYCSYYCDKMKDGFERPCVFTKKTLSIQGILTTANEECPFRDKENGGEPELKKHLSLVGITMQLKDKKTTN